METAEGAGEKGGAEWGWLRGRRRGVGGSGGGERGVATIWAVGLMAVVFVVTAAIVLAGTARVARHRVRSAADLSALAAARLALADPKRGCAEAFSLAVGNGAKLVRCSIDGYGIADVQVVLRLSLPVLGDRKITAAARAGPVHIADLAE